MKMKFECKGRISEGLIQCELYSRLKEEGIFSYPEYKCKIDGETCRFDLAIFDEKEYLMIIVECKSRKRLRYKSFKNLRNSLQYKKYMKAGVPVLYCVNLEGIENTVKQIKKILIK